LEVSSTLSPNEIESFNAFILIQDPGLGYSKQVVRSLLEIIQMQRKDVATLVGHDIRGLLYLSMANVLRIFV